MTKMSDEEIAKEYVKKECCPTCDYKAGCVDSVGGCYGFDCFLAGLKAGKPRWHYLIEDPNDLPKKEGPYWVCVRDGRYKDDGSWEWTSKPLCQTAVWMDGVFGYAGGPPVIAWCELPVFDRE